MSTKQIAFIIQARMASDRLPGKVLLPLPLTNGKPLLSWIVDELKKTPVHSDIIVATSQAKENDAIDSFCCSKNIYCYRGAENDVLSRFQNIIRNSAYDIVLRFTADNPFVDLNIIEDTISYHIDNHFDFTMTRGMPLGMDVEVVNANILLEIDEYDLSDMDKEHVTLFIKNSDRYAKGIFTPDVRAELQDLRVTVDYPSDYTLASAICSLCDASGSEQGLPLIGKMVGKYPWIFNSNKDNMQKSRLIH